MRLLRISAVAIALLVCLGPARPARSGDTGAYAGSAVIAAAGAMLCTAVAAGLDHPEGTEAYERKGWFVDLAGTYALPNYEHELEPAEVSVDSSLGVSGDIGYRCHRYFSTAVEVEKVMGFEEEPEVGTADFDPLAVTTNFKAHLPVGRFQPFALAGGGMVTDTRDAKAIVLRFGAGLDFYATKHIVLNFGIDYVVPLHDLKDHDYTSVGWGVQYRF
jgi:hypothetical protein